MCFILSFLYPDKLELFFSVYVQNLQTGDFFLKNEFPLLKTTDVLLVLFDLIFGFIVDFLRFLSDFRCISGLQIVFVSDIFSLVDALQQGLHWFVLSLQLLFQNGCLMLASLLAHFFLQGAPFRDLNQLALQILKAVVPICVAKIFQAMRTLERLWRAIELVSLGRRRGNSIISDLWPARI